MTILDRLNATPDSVSPKGWISELTPKQLSEVMQVRDALLSGKLRKTKILVARMIREEFSLKVTADQIRRWLVRDDNGTQRQD